MNPSQHILSLIPQAQPFVMIDELLYSDDVSAKTVFTIREDNIFVKSDFFQEAGLIENIAQTAAARVGHDAILLNTPIPLGFIGAINDLTIIDLPKVGDRIQTEIMIVNQVFNVTIISGKIVCGDSLLASCTMKIFLSET